jgi:hypothetical protein
MKSLSQALESMETSQQESTTINVTLQRKGRTRAQSMPRAQVCAILLREPEPDAEHGDEPAGVHRHQCHATEQGQDQGPVHAKSTGMDHFVNVSLSQALECMETMSQQESTTINVTLQKKGRTRAQSMPRAQV